ncbi:FliI/YscN family ATPase [Plastorhodobacter daqingensis]|uniref:Flagellum-specific ATP synthase n=1 Tax=Plastorhodobacter daqingensis TaxID=1387281 RepID=A0ABW2UPE6_9RHOB
MNPVVASLCRDLAALPARPTLRASGRVVRYDGQVVECDGFPVSVGAICAIDDAETGASAPILGEVIGFAEGRNLLYLDSPGARIEAGARVRPIDDGRHAAVGPTLLGRVIDAGGAPLDGLPPPQLDTLWPLAGRVMNPLERQPVDRPLDVGVRVINSMLTVGRGQRLGIIAGSGVGKSVLIEMMTRFTEAEVIVVGLIGERAREVGAFVRAVLSPETRDRVCVVAVPADRSPLLRIRGANRATAIAEYFRAQGREVLLIMDSLTRVAHARREIGLALGEQPTSKGYPPSVISLIPTLIERTGPGLPGEGSITAFYTVLADGDDTNDPVVDTARAILDGHLVLSRAQTQLGIYPAIDIPQSVSRVMSDVAGADHAQAALRLRRYVSLYQENRDLMLMGGYAPGQDGDLDMAVALWPRILQFVRQQPDERADFGQSIAALLALTGPGA